MTDLDGGAQSILEFMKAEQARGRAEISRAEIQRGTGLAYNQLVESLAHLETSAPPQLLRKTKGISSVWMLVNP
ncbi:MAG: hypothetical protein ACKVVP_02535 [Chloroflexota bacterium]